MKKIIMSGEIGWDVLPFMIREQLEGVTGDIEVDLSSIGGLISDGIEIYNILRDYKRENPESQMILNIKGEVASMATYIAANPAFDLVTIEDNATWMIHNPLTGVIGDYKEMEKTADILKRLAALMAGPYAQKSGKPIKEIREMMDNETWLFGNEIIKAGFADEMIKTKKKKEKESAIAESEIKFMAIKKKIKDKEMKQSDFEKIAAISKDFNNSIDKNDMNDNNVNANKPAAGGQNNNTEDVLMNLAELKEKHPEIYAEAIEAGKIEGSSAEKERVKTLMEMKNKKDFENLEMVKNRIDEGIANGEDVMDIKIGIQALLSRDEVKAAMDTNEIGDVKTPDAITVSGEAPKIEDDNRRTF